MLDRFETYQLAVRLYRETKTLSIQANLGDQLDRAASSIVLNCAEGAARTSRKERSRYFDIAYGSALEVRAILHLSVAPSHPINDRADAVAAHLYRLRERFRG